MSMVQLPAEGGGPMPLTEWRVPKPVKKSRRRIVCPTLPPSEAPRRHSGYPQCPQLVPVQRPPSHLVKISVRMLYFSRDGAPADTGDSIEVEISSSATIQELSRQVRDAAGAGGKSALLFKGRPLEGHLSLSDCQIDSATQGLHLMVSRKYRPSDVAERAEAAAVELASAMAAAEAEAAAEGRIPGRKKREMEARNRPRTAESIYSS
eukprot:gnl/TRDRNA2_/TRDRNA2_193779_c0_seq1.p1 gnl/TRDRNA2_/TRDRNA2_193779_c0~~gnl/TRDRNA2_/TRDRNA2_193779_c0_seq1.p1  ORF type:complete len:207 (-),score=38.48 gnl/TRDRNA2_/TRDRNA2_193779_c0_seq1:100-720(-)